VDEIHSLDAVLHAQLPRQLAVAATLTKSQQSKMPALLPALPQQMDKPKSGPYSAALLSECEIRLPANARPSKKKPEKTPKLSFMLKRLKAVLRLDGPGSGSSHTHARMSASLLVCLRNATVLRAHRIYFMHAATVRSSGCALSWE
jgi:hypothetical protein